MKCIEENYERLDLLEKTLALEEKQNKRLLDINIQEEKEMEEENIVKLYTTTINTPLDEEDSARKELVESMAQNSTPALSPIIRNLTNVQGKNSFFIFNYYFIFSFKFLLNTFYSSRWNGKDEEKSREHPRLCSGNSQGGS